MRALFLSLLIPFLAAQTATEVEVTAEPSHHLVVENEYIRAFQVEVAPQTATLMHRHRCDYIYVTIGDAHISNEVEGKTPVEVTLTDGDTRFAPGNFAHIARNLADQPFRNVTIELMQDEKLRQTPSHWPEESGETTFPGGRNKILFVKDGVRVSEVNLEPGAVAPSHHYDGPHLLVAITDLDVRSDVEGMGPMPGKFKPGDVKWLPGGYTHTPHLNECRPEPGKISDGGILESSCGDGRARPSKPSAARQPPVVTATSSPLGALDQRVPRRNQPGTVQLSSEAVFVIGSGSSGQALAQLRDFFCASAAPANFRTTAGCGHEVSLLLSGGVQRCDR